MKKIMILALVFMAAVSCKKDDDGNPSCFEPTDVEAVNIGPTSAQVQWDPGNETAFEVEYGLSGFNLGTGTVMQTSQVNLFIDGLTEETTYDAYVRSNCGSDGFSGYNSVTFTTLEPVITCNAPSDLFVIEITSNSVEFGWQPNGETAFIVEYGESGFPLGSGTEVATSNFDILIDGLDAATTYEFYVRANCGLNGLSDYSDNLVVTTNP